LIGGRRAAPRPWQPTADVGGRSGQDPSGSPAPPVRVDSASYSGPYGPVVVHIGSVPEHPNRVVPDRDNQSYWTSRVFLDPTAILVVSFYGFFVCSMNLQKQQWSPVSRGLLSRASDWTGCLWFWQKTFAVYLLLQQGELTGNTRSSSRVVATATFCVATLEGLLHSAG
jgi:hypothetical protein